MRIPEPLISKSGFTRMATLGRMPSCCPISTTRSCLGAGLQFNRHPGRYRLTKFGNPFTRTGEADVVRRHRGVERRPELQGRGDIEGIDQSTQMMDHRGHRIRFYRVAEIDGREAVRHATRPTRAVRRLRS